MKKVMFQNFIVLLFITAFSTKNDLHASPENNNPIVKADSTYNVLIEEGITYAEGLSHDGQSPSTVAIPLKLDVYAPDNDSENRPVYMFIHGGSFKGGGHGKKMK